MRPRSDSRNVVAIDGAEIRDSVSFHEVFAREFGFPGFYGRNMDAWIDCMTSLDRPDDCLSAVHCEPGEVVTIVLNGAGRLRNDAPEVYADLLECAAFVNWRRLEDGYGPVLAIAFHG